MTKEDLNEIIKDFHEEAMDMAMRRRGRPRKTLSLKTEPAAVESDRGDIPSQIKRRGRPRKTATMSSDEVISQNGIIGKKQNASSSAAASLFTEKLKERLTGATPKAETAATKSKIDLSSSTVIDVTDFAFEPKRDLRPFKYIKSPAGEDGVSYQLIHLSDGKLLRYSYEFKDYVLYKKLPKPIFLDKEATPLYFCIIAVVMFLYEQNDKVDETRRRLIEASVYLASKEGELPQTAFKNIALAASTTNEILLVFWDYFKREQSDLVMMGDSFEVATFAVYTSALPPYRYVSHGEMQKLVLEFLRFVFRNILPKKLEERGFIDAFLRHYFMSKGLSKVQLKEKLEKSGLPFKNGFALIEEGAAHIKLIPYSEETFVTSKVIDADYQPPNITKNTIFLSEGCKILLENLCFHDPYIYTVFRGGINAILHAYKTGNSNQSAFWFCGPPACAKSVIMKVFRRMVPPEKVKELTQIPNQFSQAELEDSALVLVSDIVEITLPLAQSIKKLIGRDTLRAEEKFVNGSRAIDTRCVVVFCSNFLPEDFTHLRDDEGIMNKLIVVQYPIGSRIKQEYQIPDLASYIDPYLPEIMNWALYVPPAIQINNLRATNYNKYRLTKKGADQAGGLIGYLKEHFAFSPSEEEYILVSELIQHMEETEKKSADDLTSGFRRGKSISSRRLGEAIVSLAEKWFCVHLEYKKYPKRDISPRPMLITNLQFKDHKTKEVPKGCQELIFAFSTDIIKLDDPFYATHEITWFHRLIKTKTQFDEAQKKLRDDRLESYDNELRLRELAEASIKTSTPNQNDQNIVALTTEESGKPKNKNQEEIQVDEWTRRLLAEGGCT